MAARLEALALDPVYAGKAMAGLIGLVRSGCFGIGRQRDLAPYRWPAGHVCLSGGHDARSRHDLTQNCAAYVLLTQCSLKYVDAD